MGEKTGDSRVRVAILGGGPSSLATAYYLTTREPDTYDITIYEMSWRLGGKTTSGRGQDGRIEEHGLHVLFGCYHNAFDMMMGCYAGLRDAPRRPKFGHFFEAVEAHHFGVIGDDRHEATVGWLPWHMQFPSNRAVPSDPPLPTSGQLFLTVLQAFLHVVTGARVLRWIQKKGGRLFGYGTPLPPRPVPQRRGALGGDLGVHLAMWVGRYLLDPRNFFGLVLLTGIVAIHAVWRLFERISGSRSVSSGPFGRLWVAGDLSLAVAKGIIRDRVLADPGTPESARRRPKTRVGRWLRNMRRRRKHFGDGGFEGIDHLDFREWLRLHDAASHTRESPLVRIVYDAAFSYPEGGADENNQESMAAGALLRIGLLIAFTYKHALYFKMRGGMGDIIAAPIYLLLQRRGVKFHFFHKVKAIRPAADGSEIEEVEFERVARLRQPDSYDPLVEVHGMWCWPSQPEVQQIVAEDLDDARNAERFFHAPTPKGPPILLKSRSADPDNGFDRLVFGIPVSCIPYVCQDLQKAAADSPDPDKARWGEVAKISTVQTAAVQLWCKDKLDDLGWGWPPALLSLFLDPLNTYCDMQQSLENEPWRNGRRPQMLAYFCGALPHRCPLPDAKDPLAVAAFRRAAEEEANAARDKLLDVLGQILPRVFSPAEQEGTPRFNWSVLYDPLNRKGIRRLEYQYTRANYDPHERCTLALPGETPLRMHAERTGYHNLAVAGDWVANGIYAACFEGAVQGGIRAARAIAAPTARHLYTIEAELLLNLERWTWSMLRGRESKEARVPAQIAKSVQVRETPWRMAR